jgi:hypothetical protein
MFQNYPPRNNVAYHATFKIPCAQKDGSKMILLPQKAREVEKREHKKNTHSTLFCVTSFSASIKNKKGARFHFLVWNIFHMQRLVGGFTSRSSAEAPVLFA